MGKLLVLILLVVLAVWLVQRALRAGNRQAPQSKPPEVGDLVRCARCGVHLPRSEARQAEGLLFCGEEHARLGAGKG
jgi:uncharacterized protein